MISRHQQFDLAIVGAGIVGLAHGIAEGTNGGARTIGVSVTGNVFGLTPAETQALAPDVFRTKRAEASAKLTAAGTHYVVGGVADLMPVIAAIEGRLQRGERP
jgi:phosphonoacetaldehyde hydrolase